MANSIDIAGIGDKKIATNNDAEMLGLQEYICIAEKVIATFGSRARYGLSSQMLRNEDAIANIAHSIMVADWQFNGEGSKYGFRKYRARFAIMDFITRRSIEGSRGVIQLDRGIDSDSQESFSAVLEDPTENHESIIANKEEAKGLIGEIGRMELEHKIPKKGVKYIRMHYIDEVPIKEIAQKFGITRQSVWESINNTLKKIRENVGTQYVS